MDYDQIMRKLRSMKNDKNREGMARYGIKSDNAFGVSIYVLRDMAKEIGVDHKLALELWKSGNREARILASYIDDPGLVTEKQMEKWVKDFDSWDITDQVSGLLSKTKFAREKIDEWSKREEEFVKRTAYVIICHIAVHDKNAPDKEFEHYFSIIKREANDDRNFVKKATNWALRSIGKRNLALNKRAIQVAEEIKNMDSEASRWIAADALRELRSEKVQKRLKSKNK